MKPVIDPFKQKQISRCFCIHIPLVGREEEEIKQELWRSKEVEKATFLMLNGSMSVEDLLESVEHIFPGNDIDNYADEVEVNLRELVENT